LIPILVLFGIPSLIFVGRRLEWSIHKAPYGFAVIREHTVYGPLNVPPVISSLDFTIDGVDGGGVSREWLPPYPWLDEPSGVLVSEGTHRFRADVIPFSRRPDQKPSEILFVAAVESRKIYFLVGDIGGKPILVEENSARP